MRNPNADEDPELQKNRLGSMPHVPCIVVGDTHTPPCGHIPYQLDLTWRDVIEQVHGSDDVLIFVFQQPRDIPRHRYEPRQVNSGFTLRIPETPMHVPPQVQAVPMTAHQRQQVDTLCEPFVAWYRPGQDIGAMGWAVVSQQPRTVPPDARLPRAEHRADMHVRLESDDFILITLTFVVLVCTAAVFIVSFSPRYRVHPRTVTRDKACHANVTQEC